MLVTFHLDLLEIFFVKNSTSNTKRDFEINTKRSINYYYISTSIMFTKL